MILIFCDSSSHILAMFFLMNLPAYIISPLPIHHRYSPKKSFQTQNMSVMEAEIPSLPCQLGFNYASRLAIWVVWEVKV
jgi:hypothetical protein